MQNAIARVYVNQVEVGSLPADQYRRIVDEVRSEVNGDLRLYLAQAFNLARCVARFVIFILEFVPFFCFLTLTLLALATPNALTSLLAAISQATPAEMTQGIRMALLVLGGGSTFAFLLVSLIAGHGFGYINQFSSNIGTRISLRIREILKVPADGDMMIKVRDADEAG
jgi:hypothetical protein